MIKYLGYDKILENGKMVVHAHGQFEDGRKFYITIPVTSGLLDDIIAGEFDKILETEVMREGRENERSSLTA